MTFGEDDGDVVVAAVVLGGLHEMRRGEGKVGSQRAHDELDVRILDAVVEAVRAQEIDVARNCRLVGEMRRHALLDAQRARHETAVVRLPRLGRRDDAELDLIAQQRIVARQQLEPAVAQAIDARIADVPQYDAVVVEHRRRHRGAHAPIPGVDPARLVDRLVGLVYALGERKQWPMLAPVRTERVRGCAEAGEEHLGGHAARDLAGAMAPHPVGKSENASRKVDRDAVFVVLPHVADVRQERDFKEPGRHAVKVTHAVAAESDGPPKRRCATPPPSGRPFGARAAPKRRSRRVPGGGDPLGAPFGGQ